MPTYVFNARTLAMSRWSGTLGEVSSVGGATFIAEGSGMKVLSPTTFVAGEVQTAKTDLGSSELKNVALAYVGAALTNPLKIEASPGEGTPCVYMTLTNSDTILKEHRAILGRGAVSRFWSFKISSVGKTTLRDFSVSPHTKTRRV